MNKPFTKKFPDRTPVNHFIRAKEVRLIDETGKQLGVVPLQEAMKIGVGRGLDVIQVTEKVDPPVCKLGEYGKFLYQKEKKEREAKKQGGGLKELRLTFNISQHDLETRARQAEKFLLKGDIVRVSLRLRGRENALQDVAREKMGKLVEIIKASVPLRVEREIKKEPRGLSMIIGKQ
ncbi:MAG: translation initiation factor IF-3 [Candidatus Wildermuthbacteria bacterium]|nr:translation initiation factor IF-3 [Candidatus Wildermuthbacteria bacterium]